MKRSDTVDIFLQIMKCRAVLNNIQWTIGLEESLYTTSLATSFEIVRTSGVQVSTLVNQFRARPPQPRDATLHDWCPKIPHL